MARKSKTKPQVACSEPTFLSSRCLNDLFSIKSHGAVCDGGNMQETRECFQKEKAEVDDYPLPLPATTSTAKAKILEHGRAFIIDFGSFL